MTYNPHFDSMLSWKPKRTNAHPYWKDVLNRSPVINDGR